MNPGQVRKRRQLRGEVPASHRAGVKTEILQVTIALLFRPELDVFGNVRILRNRRGRSEEQANEQQISKSSPHLKFDKEACRELRRIK